MECQSWLLQLKVPVEIQGLPKTDRTQAAFNYFKKCLDDLAPFMQGIRIVQENRYVLSAILIGGEDNLRSLAAHVEQSGIGDVVQDSRILRAASGTRG